MENNFKVMNGTAGIIIEMSEMFELEHNTESYLKAIDEIGIDAVVSAIYSKHSRMFYDRIRKFYGIDYDTKQSIILESIWKVLLNYDVERGACITTLISTYAYNACKAYFNLEQTDKRVANSTSNCESINAYQEDRKEEAADSSDYSYVEIFEALARFQLTDNERAYCALVMSDGKYTQADIARYLNVSRAAITRIKQSLKVKLAELVA